MTGWFVCNYSLLANDPFTAPASAPPIYYREGNIADAMEIKQPWNGRERLP
jgi:hypothetical protein